MHACERASLLAQPVSQPDASRGVYTIARVYLAQPFCTIHFTHPACLPCFLSDTCAAAAAAAVTHHFLSIIHTYLEVRHGPMQAVPAMAAGALAYGGGGAASSSSNSGGAYGGGGYGGGSRGKSAWDD